MVQLRSHGKIIAWFGLRSRHSFLSHHLVTLGYLRILISVYKCIYIKSKLPIASKSNDMDATCIANYVAYVQRSAIFVSFVHPCVRKNPCVLFMMFPKHHMRDTKTTRYYFMAWAGSILHWIFLHFFIYVAASLGHYKDLTVKLVVAGI